MKDELTKTEKTVDKKDFYSSKQAILLNSLDKSKIVISDKWKINDTTIKFFIGYLNEDTIKPLCTILPQMSGFIINFDDGGKNISFEIEDTLISEYFKILLKYSEHSNKIKKLLGAKFNRSPIHNEEYIKTKVKIFNGVNSTSFANDEK